MEQIDFFVWARQSGGEVHNNLVIFPGLKVEYIDLKDHTTRETYKAPPTPEPGTLYVYSNEWTERSKQWIHVIDIKRGMYDISLGARHCLVKQIDKKTANGFISEYHIQSDNNLGLAFFGIYIIKNNELVGVMSLGRHSRQISKNRIVLDRLCFKPGIKIIGGASKLLKSCKSWARNNNYDEIISFSDNRRTEGNVYEKMGFILETTYKSDYFYIDSCGNYCSKQSQKKEATGCPDEVTELEWSILRGLNRIYDYGKKRWVININPENHKLVNEIRSENAAAQHQRGMVKNGNIHGNFKSSKNDGFIYHASSFELRCMFLLEQDDTVRSYRRADFFKIDGRSRTPDLLVQFVNGINEIWEIKPKDLLDTKKVKFQIEDTVAYTTANNFGFKVWTENDSGLRDSRDITVWAKEYIHNADKLAESSEQYKARINKTRFSHQYEKWQEDQIKVDCSFCSSEHSLMKISYDRNVKKNGRYICYVENGHIVGSGNVIPREESYAPPATQVCVKCDKNKPINEFGKQARAVNHDTTCKICRQAPKLEKLRAATAAKKAAQPPKEPKFCSCGAPAYRGDLCSKHYQQENKKKKAAQALASPTTPDPNSVPDPA